MGELGKAWGKLSAKAKQPYEALAEKDKKRYAEEMASYVPPPEGELESKKKGRAKKDPNAPKRALSAYFIYANEKRADYAKDGKSVTEVAKMLGAAWKELSDTEKKPFQAK